MATSASVQSELSCGYCLQKLHNVEDPRVLPCIHICCLECLKADFRKLNAIECPVCKAMHSVPLSNLPAIVTRTATLSDETPDMTPAGLVEPISATPPPRPCDVCERVQGDDESCSASTFCCVCEQKLCEDHLKKHNEFHEAFSKEKHETISISRYHESQPYQQSEKCKIHTDRVIKISCTECDAVFCDDCNLQGYCEYADGIARLLTRHKLQSITSLIQQLLERGQVLNEKITEMAKYEKKMAKSLNEKEKKIDKAVKKVEVARDDKIRTLQEMASTSMVMFDVYKVECNQLVNYMLTENAAKLNARNTEWIDIQKLLTRGGRIEVVRQHKELLQKIEEAIFTITQDVARVPMYPPMPTYDPTAATTVPKSEATPVVPKQKKKKWQKKKQTLAAVKQDAAPSRALANEVEISGNVVCTIRMGAVLAVCADNESQRFIYLTEDTLCYDDLTWQVPATPLNISSFKFSPSRRRIVTLSFTKKSSRLAIQRGPQSNTFTDLCSFTRPENLRSHIDVSEEFISVVEPGSKSLRCFDYDGKLILHKKLSGMKRPWGVCILDDYSVVVSDTTGNSISKMKLDISEQVLWKCDGLTQPTGIAVDNHGFIFVGSCTKTEIYTVSAKGVLLQTFNTGPGFTEIWDVAVCDDRLAAASKSGGLKIYTITRTNS